MEKLVTDRNTEYVLEKRHEELLAAIMYASIDSYTLEVSLQKAVELTMLNRGTFKDGRYEADDYSTEATSTEVLVDIYPQ